MLQIFVKKMSAVRSPLSLSWMNAVRRYDVGEECRLSINQSLENETQQLTFLKKTTMRYYRQSYTPMVLAIQNNK